MGLRRKIFVVTLLLVVVLAGLTAYVIVPSARSLMAARAAVASTGLGVTQARAEEGAAHLRRALDRLQSRAADVLGLVPLWRQNLRALEETTEASLAAVEAGVALAEALEALEDQSLLRGSRIRLEVADELAPLFERQSRSLAALAGRVDENLSGWLVPPLWERLEELLESVRDAEEAVARAARLARVMPALGGSDGRRTYLVGLINNAELRGAGGIVTGLGTISVTDGRLKLGKFHYFFDLGGPPPYETIPAPADFVRRYGRYKANTTRLATATSSPDVPDVALVLSRAFRILEGTKTDGMILADPRGIAALVPPDATLDVAGSARSLSVSDLPRFVYSDAYKELGGRSPARRRALISVGEQAFKTVLELGFGGRDAVERLGNAARGGHLRFVSFVPGERGVLDELGVSGELSPPEGDVVMVTVQNFAGSKLDYWARRTLRHTCEIDEDGSALCSTEVELRNATPQGLTRYVVQDEPYGTFRNFVEVYVPGDSEVVAVTRDGETRRFFKEDEAGLSAVGLYVELPQGETTRITVGYRLPAADHYSLVIRPQPLALDADVEVRLQAPATWEFSGSGTARGEELRYSGPLDRTLEFAASPGAKTGLPAWWDGLVRFWRDPVL